jgi:hypothetical protein
LFLSSSYFSRGQGFKLSGKGVEGLRKAFKLSGKGVEGLEIELIATGKEFRF